MASELGVRAVPVGVTSELVVHIVQGAQRGIAIVGLELVPLTVLLGHNPLELLLDQITPLEFDDDDGKIPDETADPLMLVPLGAWVVVTPFVENSTVPDELVALEAIEVLVNMPPALEVRGYPVLPPVPKEVAVELVGNVLEL